MKLSAAFRETWRIARTQGRALLLTLLLETVLRALALTPLLFLIEPATRPLALLCPVLYVLVVFPARQNVALALRDALDGGSPFTVRLISGEDYGRKVLRGLTAALRMLAWCVPLLIGVGVAVWAVYGEIDGFTLMRYVAALGGGDFFLGAGRLAGLYGVTLLPPLIGCAFHSGTRHALAQGDARLLKGRRGTVMAEWFLSLALFLPFVLAAALICRSYGRALLDALNSFLTAFTLPSLPDPTPTLLGLAASFVLLALPAIPLRTLLPAVTLRAARREEQGAIGVLHAAP